MRDDEKKELEEFANKTMYVSGSIISDPYQMKENIKQVVQAMQDFEDRIFLLEKSLQIMAKAFLDGGIVTINSEVLDEQTQANKD